MPNPIWKGHISFGLVSIPIVLYSAVDASSTVSFRQIDKRNNARIRHQRINMETGKEVPWEDVVRGYEYTKGEIMVVGEGELKKVAGENAKTIAIEEFVDKKNITFLNINKAYYLVPDKKAEKGYVILREALNATNKVGIAKVIISTKEYLAAVTTFEDALVLYTLHYDEELRKVYDFDIPSEELKKYKVSSKEVDVAKQLIQSMSEKWKPEQYHDEYKQAVEKWLKEKIHKRPTKSMKQRGVKVSKSNVVDFVDLLKKSLSENKKSSAKPAKNDKKFSKKKITKKTARR